MFLVDTHEISRTFTAFIILGNYGLAQQLKHGLDITGIQQRRLRGSYFGTIPCFRTLVITSSYDRFVLCDNIRPLTLVVSAYSYKELEHTHGSDKRVRMFWSLVFILFPIALIFSENSMYNFDLLRLSRHFQLGLLSS